MSESVFHGENLSDVPPADAAREAQRKMRVENLRKAREAKVHKRTAGPRTAADAGRAGVGSNPEPAQRAHAARESAPPEQLSRMRRGERDSGWADLPNHRKKPGWDYEYKTIRVLREPVDPGDMQLVRQQGWRPEKAKDWPELVEPDASPDAPVERMGQRLYGRPMSLSNEARQEDLQTAYQQQRDKTQAAVSGRSAVRGEDDAFSSRAVRIVPGEATIEGLMGSGTGRGA